MNETAGMGDEPLPLSRRQDFTLGQAIVRPSRRLIEGPGGQVTLEPKVMQVLLALADAHGAVLNREDLLRICWNGRIVGDDAINRGIAEARRAAQGSEAGFVIETIPRTGYRLALGAGEVASEVSALPTASRRRWLVVAGGLVIAGAAGLGTWEWRRRSRVHELIAQGRLLQNRGGGAGFFNSVPYLKEAVRMEPANAEAWGLLSAGLSQTQATGPEAAKWEERAESAAQRALSLDPDEPNARVTLAVIKRGLDDWIVFERELKEALKTDPRNYFALGNLVWFFQGLGRCQESWVLNERAISVEPLSPTCQFRRALKHWILGRPAEADRVITRASEIWPDNNNVWNSRLTILAFTGRPAAALQMLDDRTTRPEIGGPAEAVWRTGLQALASGSRADAAMARATALQSFNQAPGVGANAVMLLSALGEVDAAYSVVEGFLLRRGPQPSVRTPSRTIYSHAGWRGTQWLFTPATKALRDDSRFTGLCDAIGYSGYWRRRGIWPDPFLRGSLQVT